MTLFDAGKLTDKSMAYLCVEIEMVEITRLDGNKCTSSPPFRTLPTLPVSLQS